MSDEGITPSELRQIIAMTTPYLDDKAASSLAAAHGSAATELREMATGVIIYTEDGKEHRWPIGCMAWETAEHMRKHLATWRPKAIFVSAEIIPDKRQNAALCDPAHGDAGKPKTL